MNKTEREQQIIDAMDFLANLSNHGDEDVVKAAEVIEETFSKTFKKIRKRTEDGVRETNYNETDVSGLIHKLLSQFGLIVRLFEEAQNDLMRCDRMTQDILHTLELLEITEEEKFFYANELQRIRIERRKAKDFMELAAPLSKVVNSCPGLRENLAKAHSDTIKIEQQQQIRTYKPRELNTMAEAFERAAAKKINAG